MKYKLLNLARQTGLIILVMWTVVSLVTLLIEFVPGTPAHAILGETATQEQIEDFNRRHGLDRPAFFISVSEDGSVKWNGTENRYVDYFPGFFAVTLDARSGPTDRSLT